MKQIILSFFIFSTFLFSSEVEISQKRVLKKISLQIVEKVLEKNIKILDIEKIGTEDIDLYLYQSLKKELSNNNIKLSLSNKEIEKITNEKLQKDQDLYNENISLGQYKIAKHKLILDKLSIKISKKHLKKEEKIKGSFKIYNTVSGISDYEDTFEEIYFKVDYFKKFKNRIAITFKLVRKYIHFIFFAVSGLFFILWLLGSRLIIGLLWTCFVCLIGGILSCILI